MTRARILRGVSAEAGLLLEMLTPIAKSWPSEWCLEAKQETWLLVVEGSARTASFNVAKGDAAFAQADRVNIQVGKTGMVGLVAYTGVSPVPDLLQRRGQLAERDVRPLQEVGPPVFTGATAPQRSVAWRPFNE